MAPLFECGLPDRTQHLVFREAELGDDDERPPSEGALVNAEGDEVAVIGQLLIGGREFRLECLPSGAVDWWPALILIDEVVNSHRDLLLLGGRVVELGCGVGLPSLVCALMGGNVLATDKPQALGPLMRNATVTGYPQRTWKVIAGKAAGGIVVSKNRGAGQEKEPERLSWGALVEELEKHGDYLFYRRLSGSGPDRGWVRVKQPWGQIICELTEERSSETDPSWGCLRSCGLVWGREAAKDILQGDKVDLVIASDCVCESFYGDASLPALVDTIQTLCSDRTVALMSVQRRLGDGLERFLQLLGRCLFVDRLSSCFVGNVEVLVYVARKFSRSEDFHVDLNDGMHRSAPPGGALKVIRNLRSSQSKASTAGGSAGPGFGELLEGAAQEAQDGAAASRPTTTGE